MDFSFCNFYMYLLSKNYALAFFLDTTNATAATRPNITTVIATESPVVGAFSAGAVVGACVGASV